MERSQSKMFAAGSSHAETTPNRSLHHTGHAKNGITYQFGLNVASTFGHAITKMLPQGMKSEVHI